MIGVISLSGDRYFIIFYEEMDIMNWKLWVAAACLLPTLAVSQSKQATPRLTESIGDLKFSYMPNDGANLSAHGVTFLKGFNLWIVRPGWSGPIYNYTLDTAFFNRVKIDRSSDKITLTFPYKKEFGPGMTLTGREIHTLQKDNIYHVDIAFTYSNPSQDATFELTMGEIPMVPFFGYPLRANTEKGYAVDTVPYSPRSKDIATFEECMLVNNFNILDMDSKLGTVTFKSRDFDKFILMDYRKARWSMNNNPIFWMGRLGDDVAQSSTYHFSMSVQFPKEMKFATAAGNITKEIHSVVTDNAYEPNYTPTYITPQPKSLVWGKGTMPLYSGTKIYVGKKASRKIVKAVEDWTKELKFVYGMNPKILKQDWKPGRDAGSVIVLGYEGCNDSALKELKTQTGELPNHSEGYSLQAGETRVLVGAKTEQGAFYGLQSLKQMVGYGPTRVFLKSGTVKDYPTLGMRAIHWYPGMNKGDQQAKGVKELIARWKSNNLMWNCESLHWDRHPELHNNVYGMSMSDAKKVVQTAKDNYLEMIPVICALGHTDYMFNNGQNKDLLESTTNREVYCMMKPKAYELMLDIYDEAIQLMKPKYFNCAVSEVNLDGQTVCSHLPKPKTNLELCVDELNRLAVWLKARNITPMTWADMYLYNDEGPDACNAKTREAAIWAREHIDKSYVMADWHYAPAPINEYKSFTIFKEAGFKDVLPCSWYMPYDVRNLALAAISTKSLGHVQTTWAGRDMNLDSEEAAYQYWCYILASHYTWSGDTSPIEDLPFDPAQVFFDTWKRKPVYLGDKPGRLFDLTPLYNRSLADDNKGTGFMGLGPTLDLRDFPQRNWSYNNTMIKVTPTDGRKEGAVVLAGRMNPKGTYPTSVTIPVPNDTATELHFLLTAGFRELDGAKVGSVIVQYADGTQFVEPLIYNKNIWSFTDTRVAPEIRVAWKSKTPSGENASVKHWVWTNPNPSKPITSVVLTSDNTMACPILLGMTAMK